MPDPLLLGLSLAFGVKGIYKSVDEMSKKITFLL